MVEQRRDEAVRRLPPPLGREHVEASRSGGPWRSTVGALARDLRRPLRPVRRQDDLRGRDGPGQDRRGGWLPAVG